MRQSIAGRTATSRQSAAIPALSSIAIHARPRRPNRRTHFARTVPESTTALRLEIFEPGVNGPEIHLP